MSQNIDLKSGRVGSFIIKSPVSIRSLENNPWRSNRGLLTGRSKLLNKDLGRIGFLGATSLRLRDRCQTHQRWLKPSRSVSALAYQALTPTPEKMMPVLRNSDPMDGKADRLVQRRSILFPPSFLSEANQEQKLCMVGDVSGEVCKWAFDYTFFKRANYNDSTGFCRFSCCPFSQGSFPAISELGEPSPNLKRLVLGERC